MLEPHGTSMASPMHSHRAVQPPSNASREATQRIPTDEGTAGAPRRGQRGSRLGHYEIVAPLARGGTGGVYLATDRRTGERVALKILDPHLASSDDVVARMFAECQVSTQVGHAALLHVRGAERSPDGTPYLVMEYLDGENLGALVRRGRLELGAVAAMGAQVAAALAALHEAGIAHCDIKPDNVFVLYEAGLAGWPRVKVIDYGVCRFLSEASAQAAVAGTPAYMPPEQWRGRVSAASDVYALGCLIYELVVGRPPFQGTLPQMMRAHEEHRALLPSWLRAGVPAEIDELLARMLAKAPAARPSLDEVTRVLAALAFASPPGAEVDAPRAMVG